MNRRARGLCGESRRRGDEHEKLGSIPLRRLFVIEISAHQRPERPVRTPTGVSLPFSLAGAIPLRLLCLRACGIPILLGPASEFFVDG
jgi:hypothetical protein